MPAHNSGNRVLKEEMMRDRDAHEAVAQVEPQDKADSCKHYWLIEPPTGPTSDGVCRLCGEKRAFDNSQSATARPWGSSI